MVLPDIRHLIGEGRATNLWSDPWMQDGDIRDMYFHGIISKNGWLFPPTTSRDLKTLCATIEAESQPEPLFFYEIEWTLDEHGNFTLKSAYAKI